MSRSKRTNAVLMSLMLAFVVTLGAGVVVGMVAGRRSPTVEVGVPATTRPAEAKSEAWLPDALNLNAEQQKKLKAIWTDTVQGPLHRANYSKRVQFAKDRDEAVYNLLTPEQKQQYQKVLADYTAKLADLNKEREKAIQEAVERTKLMLDDKQRDKYDQILKDQGPFPRGDHDRQPHGSGPRAHIGPGGGRGTAHFGDPRTQPSRGGPTTEEFREFRDSKETGSATTRP